MSIIRTRSQERLDLDAEKAALLAAAQEQARAEEEISARLPREVLNINKRLDQQQVSMDKLQGDMSNLMAMVSQINTKLGKQPERTASLTEPPPTSTAFSTPPAYHPALSPIPEVSTPGDSSVSATAPPPARPLQFGNPNSLPYVAPKSFGEIPTPRSGYENYYYRHPNPIHSSCVQSGSTNLSEQHLDGLPHHYGFDNLNCQTVFRADGSEHSYFALPENYPFELATPEQVLNINDDTTDGCSNEFVDVFTTNLKLQQQVDEKTSNCLIIKASDSVFTLRRKEWDPGILKQMDVQDAPNGLKELYEEEQQDSAQSHKCSSKVPKNPLPQAVSEACIQFSASNAIKFVLHGTSLVLQKATHPSLHNYCCSLHCQTEYYHKRCSWKLLICGTKRMQWDPGVQLSLDSCLDMLTVWSDIATPLWQNQCSSWFNPMDYCQKFQKYNAMCSQLYWNQDIKFIGISLWLISFNPP